MKKEFIRNFSIIAHIDHGKSTLADRLLQYTHSVDDRNFRDQILDSMDIERERGITIKAQVATMEYKSNDGNTYLLNLIDTPGHVDFAYEVSRALAACDGVLLVVDAAQGVEAQTVANMYQAMEHDLKIIPIINKIDLPSANIEDTTHQIEHDLGLDTEGICCISAKDGINIDRVLEAIVKQIPAPKGDIHGKPQALIFDSFYDKYRGVVTSIRLFEGTLHKGDSIKMFRSDNTYEIDELGYYRLKPVPKKELSAGEVGYIIAGIKNLKDTKIGDTITDFENPCPKPLPGYKEVKPMVYAGLYPMENDDYEILSDALEKLQLNDASLIYQPESSIALGFGFRCGFLGLLHLEIIQERLSREFDLALITTAPSVEYEVRLTSGEDLFIDNPALYPEPQSIDYVKEPFARVSIIIPNDFVGNVMQIVMERRGIQINMFYLDERRVQIDYDMPLSEIIYEFHDRIKTVSKGYASYDYFILDYRKTDVVKLDILVNGEKIDALSQLVHEDKARMRGKFIVEKLKDSIPRHMFKIPLQAAVGGKIIARENINAFRKNVTAKCYGGDITRKRKLLEKQKEGKKKMRQFGNVDIPQEAFLSVLKTNED
jgi:GTP-binding protein LepA